MEASWKISDHTTKSMAELELIPDLLSDSPVFSSVFHDGEEAIWYLIGGEKFIEFWQ